MACSSSSTSRSAGATSRLSGEGVAISRATACTSRTGPGIRDATRRGAGRGVGTLDAEDVNTAQRMLQAFAERGLSDKVVVVHQFLDTMITRRGAAAAVCRRTVGHRHGRIRPGGDQAREIRLVRGARGLLRYQALLSTGPGLNERGRRTHPLPERHHLPVTALSPSARSRPKKIHQPYTSLTAKMYS